MSWNSLVEQKCLDLEQRLVTEGEFRKELKRFVEVADSPLRALEVVVTPSSPFAPSNFGSPGIGEPTESRSFKLDQIGTSCSIKIWLKPSVEPDLANLLINFVQCYWKKDLRDRSTIVFLQNAAQSDLIENTLAYFIQEHGKLAFFYCDLDWFKSVNDALGHQEGDRIIREFASILDNKVRPYGIAIHRSGDEFILLHRMGNADSSVAFAYDFMNTVQKHDFNVGDVQLGIKVGIALIDSKTHETTYAALETHAVSATKNANGEVFRGRARLYTDAEPQPPPFDDFALDLACCVARSNVAVSAPFANPWLSFISAQVQSACAASGSSQLDNVINNAIGWIQPDLDQSVITSALKSHGSVPMRPIMSFVDVAMAVTHGLLKYALIADAPHWKDSELVLVHSSGGVVLKLVPDGNEVFRFGDPGEKAAQYNLGRFWTAGSVPEPVGKLSSRIAVLIKIGHFELDLPESLFYEITTVDDRPTRGGGLPDFWEATIARLIGAAIQNSNLCCLFVFGPHKWGAKTIQILKTMSEWKQNVRVLSIRTGMAAEEIEKTATMFNGRAYFPNSRSELISTLVGILRKKIELSRLPILPLPSGVRFLRRSLDSGTVSLDEQDGCRVPTLARAYPTVLELTRRRNNETAIRDQAGQELRELIDFKVVLTTPEQEMTPSFYAKETDSLERYYSEVFDLENGLFGKHLAGDGQLNAVLQHLVSSITGSNPYSSRRAILIVPHVVTENQALAPLGLVSVRIIPRVSSHRVIVHFSYTWRTVEVLVGFPYSLYASVRFSQDLVERLKVELGENAIFPLNMGVISYVAHSLHVFLDEYRQNIARQIVNDASE